MAPLQNRDPIARLSGPSSVSVGVEVSFDGSASSDPDPSGIKRWKLSDSTGQVRVEGDGHPPTYIPVTFTATGVCDVSLEVWDNKKRRGAMALVVTVSAGAPPVPVDCVLGPWALQTAGTWGACQPNGTQTRTETWTRVIVTHPANGGAACGPTTETRTGTQGCVYVPLPSTGRQLLGGWRIEQEFARGAIAIDFSRMKMWMAGHAQRREIVEFDLPAMGSGADLEAWPAVRSTRVIQSWWPKGYANGLLFWRGKVWVSPRVFYDTPPSSAEPLTLYAMDGEKIDLPYSRQAFSGFVKRGPGLDPFIGCGGYESGQGTQSGPSLATLAGQQLISYGWPGEPGANLEHWNERAPRAPNYRPLTGFTNLADLTPGVPGDSWTGWTPRVVDGQLQGRWASDMIFAGGLVLPEGITYWPWMGLGDLDYRFQTYTFTLDRRTYAYRYDPTTFQLLGYEAQPQFDTNLDVNALTAVLGQELGPDGKVYLAHGYQWASGAYMTDVALKVYG